MNLDKIAKKLPDAVVEELDTMDKDKLNAVCAQAAQAIETATDERDENPEYIHAKQACTDLSAGLRDVKAFQGAKIKYALIRLAELGAGTGELNDDVKAALERIRNGIKGRKPDAPKKVVTLSEIRSAGIAGLVAQSMADAAVPGVSVTLNGKPVKANCS